MLIDFQILNQPYILGINITYIIRFNVIEYTKFIDRILDSPQELTLKLLLVEYSQFSENISKMPPPFPTTHLFEARFSPNT